jgi:hypothetical protein
VKRPAFQFYPADWRKDSALQSCGMAARGLWHEMVCIMHECVPYGHLSVNGNPISTAQLGRLVGESERSVRNWLVELKAAGVYSETEEGVIYSRRMVKDERVRNTRAEAGRLGGNPILLNQKVNHQVNGVDNLAFNQEPTPSSSSSSSSQRLSPPCGFVRFWEAWPKSPRKEAKGQCLTVWKRKGFELQAAEILRHVEAMKRTEQWRTGYEPAPLVYLKNARWEGAEMPQPQRADGLAL